MLPSSLTKTAYVALADLRTEGRSQSLIDAVRYSLSVLVFFRINRNFNASLEVAGAKSSITSTTWEANTRHRQLNDGCSTILATTHEKPIGILKIPLT
jgi:hypothetical protein